VLARKADNAPVQGRRQQKTTTVGLGRGTDRHRRVYDATGSDYGAEVLDAAVQWRSTLMGRTAWKITGTSDAQVVQLRTRLQSRQGSKRD
jgi:hypothetical protein